MAWLCPFDRISVSIPFSIPPAFSPYFLPSDSLQPLLYLLAQIWQTVSSLALPLLICKGLFCPWRERISFMLQRIRLGTKATDSFCLMWTILFPFNSLGFQTVADLWTQNIWASTSSLSWKCTGFFLSIFNNLSWVYQDRGHIISQALSSYWKGKIVNLRRELGTGT